MKNRLHENPVDRVFKLRNSELDCLIDLDDIVAEMAALQLRVTITTAALRDVRREIRRLERSAA